MNCGFAVQIDIVFPVSNKVILAKGRWEEVLLSFTSFIELQKDDEIIGWVIIEAVLFNSNLFPRGQKNYS